MLVAKTHQVLEQKEALTVFSSLIILLLEVTTESVRPLRQGFGIDELQDFQ